MIDATAALPVIDVHAHVVLDATMGAAGRYGPELVDGHPPAFRAGDYVLRGVAYRGSAFMDVDVRLAAMDAAGIDRQVLSPNPLTYFHFVEADVARAFCRRHNDALAALVAGHPERLLGLAALPMQDPPAAIDELRRAVGELGLAGAAIGPAFAGHELDDPALDRFYATCVELDVPLFIHPAPEGTGGCLHDPRLTRFDLDLLAGFAHDETVAVATLIFGGVLDRHPQLDVCVSHGGGATPYLYGRLAAAARERPWAPDALREPGGFEAALRRLWFDCHVHDPRALRLLVDVCGTDRVAFGTNFAGWDQGTAMDLGELDGPIRLATARLLRLVDHGASPRAR